MIIQHQITKRQVNLHDKTGHDVYYMDGSLRGWLDWSPSRTNGECAIYYPRWAWEPLPDVEQLINKENNCED